MAIEREIMEKRVHLPHIHYLHNHNNLPQLFSGSSSGNSNASL